MGCILVVSPWNGMRMLIQFQAPFVPCVLRLPLAIYSLNAFWPEHVSLDPCSMRPRPPLLFSLSIACSVCPRGVALFDVAFFVHGGCCEIGFLSLVCLISSHLITD